MQGATILTTYTVVRFLCTLARLVHRDLRTTYRQPANKHFTISFSPESCDAKLMPLILVTHPS